MTSLGNFHHDFPRLAKQSGYFFQLYRGRVNWSQIECLSIDDIIQERNFQLLEQNLLNVINCNLEREYDLKILDQNFVKLFKLAQLGVDYLSYCQQYLDRCVILLQEQLLAVQEEYEAFKLDHRKKMEELKKSAKKMKTQNFQCDKCEKVFISDVYLKFHDKRRHSNPNTPKSIDTALKRCIDTCQQTEDRRKLTASTQTVCLDKEVPEVQESEEISKIKTEHNIKIGKLENELEDLKTRLKKAENRLTEKAEHSNPNLPTYSFPGPIYYPSMLPFIPPYLPPSQRGYYEVNPGCHMSVPQYNQPSNSSKDAKVGAESDVPQLKAVLDQVDHIPERESTKPESRSEENKSNTLQAEPDNDKENLDPDTIVSKPRPLPRKSKTQAQKPFTVHTNNTKTVQPETDYVHFNQESLTSSTPLKEKRTPSESKESLVSNANERESLSSRDTTRSESKSKSFIKKLVKRNSPRLRKFSKNLKKSLTNLCDSVSASGKESPKAPKEPKCQNSRMVATDEVNSRLREMGIDPEWSGIPEKTMKQNLKALKHRRRLLSKENPMYPVIRQNLEQKLLRSIRTRFVAGKKPAQAKEHNEEESTEVQGFTKMEDSSHDQKVAEIRMYETDSETDTKVSDAEENVGSVRGTPPLKTIFIEDLNGDSESKKEDKIKEKEFDLSIFQVGRGPSESLQKGVREIDDLLTDSDFDDDFLGNFEAQDFRAIHAEDKHKNDNQNKRDAGNEKEFLFFHSGNESQSILKSIHGNQSKLQLNSKKKVLFANHSDEADKDLSDLSPTNDDIWSLKSDWDKDVS